MTEIERLRIEMEAIKLIWIAAFRSLQPAAQEAVSAEVAGTLRSAETKLLFSSVGDEQANLLIRTVKTLLWQPSDPPAPADKGGRSA